MRRNKKKNKKKITRSCVTLDEHTRNFIAKSDSSSLKLSFNLLNCHEVLALVVVVIAGKQVLFWKVGVKPERFVRKTSS